MDNNLNPNNPVINPDDTDCPICGRELHLPSTERHHLIPKTFKGKIMVRIHKVCHQKIHSVFTERELLAHYHTVDRLKNHEQMVKFIKWVKKKPPEFYDKNDDTKDRKKGRRK